MGHRMYGDEWTPTKHPKGERAIKGLDRYQRRVWIGEQPFRLYRRGSDALLQAGEEFYIRPATSAVGWRVVLGREITKVYSVTGPDDMHTVTHNSEPWEDR